MNRIDTRTTTRAPTRKYTCHVGNDALPFHPRSDIFSPDLSSPVVITRGDSLLTRDSIYIGRSHTHCSHQPRKNPSRDFATRSSLTSSSLFARHVVVSYGGHSYAIVFRGCFARIVVDGEGRASRSTLKDREKEGGTNQVARDPRLRNLLHSAIFASSVNFSLLHRASVFSHFLERNRFFFLPLLYFFYPIPRFFPPSFYPSIHDSKERKKKGAYTLFPRD